MWLQKTLGTFRFLILIEESLTVAFCGSPVKGKYVHLGSPQDLFWAQGSLFLEALVVTFCESLAADACSRSLDCHFRKFCQKGSFWKCGLLLVVKVSWKMLVYRLPNSDFAIHFCHHKLVTSKKNKMKHDTNKKRQDTIRLDMIWFREWWGAGDQKEFLRISPLLEPPVQCS